MWDIGNRIEFLLELRRKIGPRFGSEDLCVLLYSLVKRERPAVVVELGTGYGVTTAWIAAAMRENGHGRIFTFDNGSQFMQPHVLKFMSSLSGGPLAELAEPAKQANFPDYLKALFRNADVADHVTFGYGDMVITDLSWLREAVAGEKIDLLFSDFDHVPEVIIPLLGQSLPLMNSVASIFIDSASTHLPSFLTLERLVDQLNKQQLPKSMSDHLSEEQRQSISRLISCSNFKLMHLLEKLDRSQNSTAWLRIEPVDLSPPPITGFLH